MTALHLTASQNRAPTWLATASLCGIVWNLFGAFQFAAALTATTEALVASGLTPEQAAALTGYPLWMTLAFGLGVAGGLVGSMLLLLRHRSAGPVLGVSLSAYVALWIGDAVHGVFAAMGTPQVIVLSMVVAIAAALFTASRHPAARP